ncbi:MAG: hypothetical protein ACRDT4_23020 [Micromonosporaceae bacterium]
MSFEDLADDWPQTPLTEPTHVADVLDLLVTDASRALGAIYVVLCDSQDRMLQPCAVDGPPAACDNDTREQMFRPFVEALATHEPNGAVLVALARPDGLEVTAEDRAWQQAAMRVCARAGIRLLGLHVVTRHGSREVPPGNRAA